MKKLMFVAMLVGVFIMCGCLEYPLSKIKPGETHSVTKIRFAGESVCFGEHDYLRFVIWVRIGGEEYKPWPTFVAWKIEHAKESEPSHIEKVVVEGKRHFILRFSPEDYEGVQKVVRRDVETGRVDPTNPQARFFTG